MSGTVGLERPSEMGAWLRGVFWGVGAVPSVPEALILTLDDILNDEVEEMRVSVLRYASRLVTNYSVGDWKFESRWWATSQLSGLSGLLCVLEPAAG